MVHFFSAAKKSSSEILYQPADGSPGPSSKAKDDSDSEEDTLDAFMSNLVMISIIVQLCLIILRSLKAASKSTNTAPRSAAIFAIFLLWKHPVTVAQMVEWLLEELKVIGLIPRSAKISPPHFNEELTKRWTRTPTTQWIPRSLADGRRQKCGLIFFANEQDQSDKIKLVT